MDDGYGLERHATITGKIVYEKDGIRQEKDFSYIIKNIFAS